MLRLLFGLTIIYCPNAFSAKSLIVKYKSSSRIAAATDIRGMKILNEHPVGRLLEVSFVSGRAHDSIMALTKDPNIEYIVPNSEVYAVEAFAKATGETLSTRNQYAINVTQTSQAWTLAGSKGSKNVSVAVIDTGVDYNHPVLAGNTINGYDFVDNDNNPMDEIGGHPGHGTHCAGIVGGNGQPESSIFGSSPEVSIMPIRFIDARGSGETMNAVRAIDYAISKKVRVMSNSWGARESARNSMPIIEAIKRADRAGIVFVAAAGNNSSNNDVYDFYPANTPTTNMINVGSSDSGDQRSSFSNYGKAKVHIAAPGSDIISSLPNGNYNFLSGTSMAAPLVSGVVAIVLAQDPNLKPLQLRSLLQATGDRIHFVNQCNCRVNTLNAIDTVISKRMFVSPYAGTFRIGDQVEFEGVYGSAPFKFESYNTNAATIDSNSGLMIARANGVTQITVTDSKGVIAKTYEIVIGAGGGGSVPPPGGSPNPPPPEEQPPTPPNPPPPSEPPPNPGRWPEKCPYTNPKVCEVVCRWDKAPWCKK